MKTRTRLFLSAMTISFLGSLPLGILNVSVANFMFNNDIGSAIGFSIAAIFVEMVLVRLALTAIKQFEKFKPYFRFLSLITCFLLLMLSFNTLAAAYQKETFHAELSLIAFNPVLSGLLLSILNPLHLPFWMGWIVVLKSNKLLNDESTSCNYFVVAIGMGTATAFVVYGIAGRYVIELLNRQQIMLNWLVGITLLITALALLYKNFVKTLYR